MGSVFNNARSVQRTKNTERRMSAVMEASATLDVMFGRKPDEAITKAMLLRAFRAVNPFYVQQVGGSMTFSRIEDLWRKEARRVDAEEMDAIRAAREAQKAASLRAAFDRPDAREARDELAELRARLGRIETALRVSDPLFHRATLDALGGVDGGPRRVDRSLDEAGE